MDDNLSMAIVLIVLVPSVIHQEPIHTFAHSQHLFENGINIRAGYCFVRYTFLGKMRIFI